MVLGEGISNYNGDRSIEVVEDGDTAFLGDGRLELAGSMLDFWDEQATEAHPGHNWDDPGTGLWHEAWLNTDQTITEVCQFRVNWHAAGRPVTGETIMDHDGVLACP
jgi:hypothetical protein